MTNHRQRAAENNANSCLQVLEIRGLKWVSLGEIEVLAGCVSFRRLGETPFPCLSHF